jgi:hypothetical protein
MRRIIAGLTVNAYESRASCERSGSNPASSARYTGLRKSARAGVIMGRSHEGGAPEENRIAEEYAGRLLGDEKMYSSYARSIMTDGLRDGGLIPI